MSESFVPVDSEYAAPGVAVWAPRLRLTVRGTEERSGGTRVEFEASDNAAPDLTVSAVVHESVQLIEGVEYFAYFVPVEAMVPPE